MFTQQGISIEVVKNYPKSFAAFKSWVSDQLTSFQRMISEFNGGEGFDPISDEDAENGCKVLITTSIRSLYDFFDKYKVYMTIEPKNDGSFVYKVNGILGGFYETRINAENDGFVKCFEQLEKQL